MSPPPDSNRPEGPRSASNDERQPGRGRPAIAPAGRPAIAPTPGPAIAPVRIVVVGTGTNIGKTHLSVALVTHLARAGRQVCGLKPIESGVPAGGVGPDAAALAAAGVFHVKHPQPYALPDPVSPHLAARRLGLTIDLAPVTEWVDAHPADYLVIETAGALLSPISPTATNLDLARALTPDVWLLVAADRLGVLHDVAACVLALKAHGIVAPPVVVLQSPPAMPDDSTGTNAAELVALGTVPRAFTMPRGDPGSLECQAAAGVIAEALVG